MSRSLSMFTATADMEVALAVLASSAFGRPRDEVRLSVSKARELFANAQGVAALSSLAERLGLSSSVVPNVAVIDQLFDDELLSMRALKLHRGRNVYSAGKLALWNALWAPFRDALVPDDATMSTLHELVASRSVAGAPDLARCADLLSTRLRGAGFAVETRCRQGHAPILIARRPARGLAGRLVLYGHYDAAETAPDEWESDPWSVVERDGRFYGCAIGDNKAALAVRLAAIDRLTESPELVWVIQGEEEIGSPFAHDEFPDLLRSIAATVWLEENGYHDVDGTQRILARIMGAASGELAAPDSAQEEIAAALAQDAETWGVRTRVEVRGLNKDFFPRGCPFNQNLPEGARYLSIGVNDPKSGIHRPNESVPTWTFALHARQIATLFREIDRLGRRGL